MRRSFLLLLLLASVSCASTGTRRDDGSADIFPPPSGAQQQTAVSDARLAEMQTSLTELLERIDVLNDRISRLETAPADQRAASVPSSPVTSAGPEPALTTAPAVARATAPGTVPASSSRGLLGAKIAGTYRDALEMFGRNKFAEARGIFQQVYDLDPNGELADNALFWMGETFFAQQKYSEAMELYSRVVRDYPNENKAPNALFKMGVTYEKKGDLGLAKQTLEDCVKRYPYAPAAAAARSELKRIRY